MFSKVLIANRGEIACRVTRTLHRLGIGAVAVYSDADRRARHVLEADEAYHIGPSSPRESYLHIERVIEAAKRSGAEALHPGYGFLSENPEFAEACAREGIVFIGPGPEAMRLMGLKDTAKRRMEGAGVPVVPGYHGEEQNPEVLLERAREIGFPVLIKATAGGGGKGMRRVGAAEAFRDALGGAQREARSAFGNERVLVERLVEQPRHIEIQVFADAHGNAVHLFERDCSLQRRHQKVVEEAPAPGMPSEMRAQMGAAAVAACAAIGYLGAGTVEFIADSRRGLSADTFYFMEMNTRLQVEHPVTEMITGEDLVEWQLRVAAGERLPLAQDALAINGHAVEVRLYAEDPAEQFRPATGRLVRLEFPPDSDGVRVESGVNEGDTIGSSYDPMIAKIIAHGRDRGEALARMQRALARVRIGGCVTNTEFLRALLARREVVEGTFDTELIDRELDALIHAGPVLPDALVLAALHEAGRLGRDDGGTDRAAVPAMPLDPWSRGAGWRLFGHGRQQLSFEHRGESVPVAVRHGVDGGPVGQIAIDIDGHAPIYVEILARDRDDRDRHTVSANGRVFHGTLFDAGDRLQIGLHEGAVELLRPNRLAVDSGADATLAQVKAPLPGRIVRVDVAEGDVVASGDTLAVLEAMKMELAINSPRDGTIELLSVQVGEPVEEGQVLVVFASASESESK